jgi:hypothetical protein
MPIVDYPAFKQYPQFKGLFVGGCVDRGDGSSFRRKAHAHTDNPNEGWICVRSMKRIGDVNKPNMLMLHEVAHLISGHGHDDVWRKAAKAIGYRLDFWETKEYNQCRKMGLRPTSFRDAKACLRQMKKASKGF